MKICIWYETTTAPWGGANSFLAALAESLRAQGDEVVDRPLPDCSIILLNSWSRGQGQSLTSKEVKQLRYGSGIMAWFNRICGTCLPPPVIIHRLDGIARLYGRYDNVDAVQLAINPFTDSTIFQSAYCRKSFEEAGVRPKQVNVIHNGVNPSIFFPDAEHRTAFPKLKLLAASWSSNPMKGFAQLAEIARIPGIELSFVGNWCSSIDPGPVKLLGVQRQSELATLLREHDAFVHAAENDPCPNVVLEALASGLPVLYRESGGTPELSRKFGVSLENGHQNAIEELLDSYCQLRERLLDERSTFDVSQVAKRYREVFVQALERRTHG